MTTKFYEQAIKEAENKYSKADVDAILNEAQAKLFALLRGKSSISEKLEGAKAFNEQIEELYEEYNETLDDLTAFDEDMELTQDEAFDLWSIYEAVDWADTDELRATLEMMRDIINGLEKVERTAFWWGEEV